MTDGKRYGFKRVAGLVGKDSGLEGCQHVCVRGSHIVQEVLLEGLDLIQRYSGKEGMGAAIENGKTRMCKSCEKRLEKEQQSPTVSKVAEDQPVEVESAQ